MAAALLCLSFLVTGTFAQKAGVFSPDSALTRNSTRPSFVGVPKDASIRERTASVDFNTLDLARPQVQRSARRSASSSTIELNLFDNVSYTGIVERRAPTSSGYSLSGSIQGVEFGTFALVVNGKIVAGTVRLPQVTYWIRSDENGLYGIYELDPSRLPQLGDANDVVELDEEGRP